MGYLLTQGKPSENFEKKKRRINYEIQIAPGSKKLKKKSYDLCDKKVRQLCWSDDTNV